MTVFGVTRGRDATCVCFPKGNKNSILGCVEKGTIFQFAIVDRHVEKQEPNFDFRSLADTLKKVPNFNFQLLDKHKHIEKRY